MELLLIRHALPVRIDEGAVDGPADPALAEVGLRQAVAVAEWLAEEQIDAIWSSPMRRARETAAPISDRLGLSVTIDEGIAEYDKEALSYIPVEELKAANDPRWQAMLRGEWTVHEETPEQFRGRVVAAIEQLIDAHSGDRIAIVCHGGVINGYLGHILELPNPQGFFYPNYTSIHRVAAARSGERSIVTVNETSHLRRTGLPMGLFQGTR